MMEQKIVVTYKGQDIEEIWDLEVLRNALRQAARMISEYIDEKNGLGPESGGHISLELK